VLPTQHRGCNHGGGFPTREDEGIVSSGMASNTAVRPIWRLATAAVAAAADTAGAAASNRGGLATRGSVTLGMGLLVVAHFLLHLLLDLLSLGAGYDGCLLALDFGNVGCLLGLDFGNAGCLLALGFRDLGFFFDINVGEIADRLGVLIDDQRDRYVERGRVRQQRCREEQQNEPPYTSRART